MQVKVFHEIVSLVAVSIAYIPLDNLVLKH